MSAHNDGASHMPLFNDVPAKPDFPSLERVMFHRWAEAGTVGKYLARNLNSGRRFSFVDGPLTANGLMGVHHAWGRTYKDLFQRYHAMLGDQQRFQNGFDCQGLWVEVEVEKELGLKSKRDIESYGVAAFVEKCKERVQKYADLQTLASQRLGYWMNWDHSYFTMSDANNYAIWHFLKQCHRRGLLYKGQDVMPWCPRCATGMSEHEIVTEGYRERSHRSLYVRFPIATAGPEGEYLLAWTTTPWTLAANVALAVHPDLVYLKVRHRGSIYYLARDAAARVLRGSAETLAELPGRALLSLTYAGPYDELPAAMAVRHMVVPWKAVGADGGTGIVHIAPGCGKEDFSLGKEQCLDVIAPVDEFGVFREGFGWLSGRSAGDVTSAVADDLRGRHFLYRDEFYTHRYPVCWRCETDLIFRLVDEWFIAMGPLRQPMMELVDQIRWLPAFGKERERDWLRNMSDWMISKKRYWGLALPIYECAACGSFEVIGSKAELRDRAVEGWAEFESHSPHRPWVDSVKIACGRCGRLLSRILDVGNPWLDAGIVPFSTLGYPDDIAYWKTWFPADFITESFPGQFRNWFYSLLAQSAVLVNRPPFKTVLGYGLVRDETGREMHKSWGNAIEFDEGAEEMGVDVMRWLFCSANPSADLNFGYNLGNAVRRRFILPLWNTYFFFLSYARLDGFDPRKRRLPVTARSPLDRWLLARLNDSVRAVRDRLDDYDAQGATRAVEAFVVDDLSNWYIRRSRSRFWRAEEDEDKVAAYLTLYETLVTVSKLVAPMIPFLGDQIYQTLVPGIDPATPESVHLCDYPTYEPGLVDAALLRAMETVRRAVEIGRALRSWAGVRVRQPLPRLFIKAPSKPDAEALMGFRDLLLDELNVKDVLPLEQLDAYVEYQIRPNLPILGPRFGKRLPEIIAAIAATPARDVVRQLTETRHLTIRLDDRKSLVLLPEELLVDTRPRGGYAVLGSDGFLAALDTVLTPQLIREGLARDFVRHVQDMRKSAGLRLDERIVTYYLAPAGSIIDVAIKTYADFIKRETLSRELIPASTPEWLHQATIPLGDVRVTVSIVRRD